MAPKKAKSVEVSKNFLKAVDQSIRDVREAAYEVLAKIQAKRIKKNLNDYQVGDFVLVDAKGMIWKKNKLAPNYFGPFRVEEVYKSDVSVRHIVTEDRRVKKLIGLL
jgi:ribosomal protein L21E